MKSARYMRGRRRKGFTLVELIIAIAIIAIVATTAIVLINPVNMFREARDAQRIADVEQMNRVMSLYSANVGDLSASICDTKCYAQSVPGVGFGTAARCGQRYSATTNNTTVTSSVQAVDGTGWVPIDLRPMSVGVPIASWPIDPKTVVNLNGPQTQVLVGTSQYYSFACLNNAWEFTAHLESVRYASSNSEADGGTDLRLYEVGTNVGL